MYNIIAICGAKRSGKDVLSKYLTNKYKYKKIYFAEPLKKAVKELFNFNDVQVGIDEDNANGDEKDKIDDRWGISPRKALQYFGTEIMQYKINDIIPNINRDFFANILVSKLIEKEKYVISDLRFLHEYEKIKGLNIIIIKIKRPYIYNDNSNDNVNYSDKHISENEFEKIPNTIELLNNGTIENFIENFELLNKKYNITE